MFQKYLWFTSFHNHTNLYLSIWTLKAIYHKPKWKQKKGMPCYSWTLCCHSSSLMFSTTHIFKLNGMTISAITRQQKIVCKNLENTYFHITKRRTEGSRRDTGKDSSHFFLEGLRRAINNKGELIFPLQIVRPTSSKEIHSHRLPIISHGYLKVNGEIVSPLYPKESIL